MRRVLRLHVLRRGGKSSTGSSGFVNSVYFAQLTTSGVGAWSNTTSYPLKAQSPSCVTSSGYVYCVGGYTAENQYDSVGSVFYARITSTGVGAWTSTTTYPTPHGQSSCVGAGGYIHCAGNAAHGRAPINSSGVGAWSSVGFPGPGGPPGCDSYEIVAFGYLYCIGSMSSGQPSASVYYASVNYTSPDDWLRTLDYPVPVTGESCVTSKGYVYCVAGASSSGEMNSAYFSQILHPLVSANPTNGWVADHGARLSVPSSTTPAGIQLPD